MLLEQRAGRGVRGWLVLFALLALAAPAWSAPAEGFSFFGVRFGMTAAEVNTRWNRLGEGAYSVPALGIQEVQAGFDHEGRLYEISFTLVPPESKAPELIQMRAIQQAVDSRWGKGNPALDVSVAVGRAATRIRITDKKLLEGFIASVQEQIGSLLKP